MTENELVEKLCPILKLVANGGTGYISALESAAGEDAILPHIRSYANALVAAAVEACAKHDPTVKLDESGDVPRAYIVCDCGWDGRRKLPWDTESWKNHIRSTVAPEAAAKELERIKAEAQERDEVASALSISAAREIEVRELRQQNDALVSASRGLMHECKGMLGLEKAELRRLFSNTNIAVWEHWIEQVRIALAVYASVEEAQGKPASGTEAQRE